jgi:hypothetical protein
MAPRVVVPAAIGRTAAICAAAEQYAADSGLDLEQAAGLFLEYLRCFAAGLSTWGSPCQ